MKKVHSKSKFIRICTVLSGASFTLKPHPNKVPLVEGNITVPTALGNSKLEFTTIPTDAKFL